MPKAVALRKVTALRGAPVDTTVKFKSLSRGRNKAGRATANDIKTTLEFLPSEPTPLPPSVLPDMHSENPEDPESDDEELIQLKTQKGPSRAVSVSLCGSRGVDPS